MANGHGHSGHTCDDTNERWDITDEGFFDNADKTQQL